MKTIVAHSLRHSLTLIAATALLAACGDKAPVAPEQPATIPAPELNRRPPEWGRARAIATLQLATARYHDLNVAIKDGFVFLHGCETRGDEGPVGTVYVHMGRLTDGKIDPSQPDALIYEPRPRGQPRLVGVELAVPYALWTTPTPPKFLGATFQREDEFGVFGLHVWVWRNNPEGLFAESNPRVSCGVE